jgi:hypothetical protein
MERKLVVDQLKLSYDGLFDLPELYRIIDGFFYEKGWDKLERVNQEQITPQGRQIRIILEPWKSATDYFRLVIQIKLHAMDVTHVEVEKQGAKIKLNQGTIRMIMNGYVVSDRQGKWEKSPFLWFLHIIFNKYFFKEHHDKAERWVLSDIDDLYQRIKTFLNVYKYGYATTPPEQGKLRL